MPYSLSRNEGLFYPVSDPHIKPQTPRVPTPDHNSAPPSRLDITAPAPPAGTAASQQEKLEYKREDFNLQASDLLPLALEAIKMGLESESPKDALAAAKLLLRNQGLLVDKVQTIDKNAITTLFEELRRPRPITKTLPNPKDYVDGEAREI